MSQNVLIGNRWVGEGYSAFIIGEIGINHNGDINIAKRLIDAAVLSGCDAVKFQKRTPEQSVPTDMRDVKRETPWGVMTYLEYRYKVEFGYDQYREIDSYCAEKGIQWFSSCWDEESVTFMERFSPVCYKIASASITDIPLLNKLRETGRPLILSTGMSTMDEIEKAVELLADTELLIAHTTSTYPCPPAQSNLRMIATLKQKYDVPIGYSGHEVGLQISCAAVALGATFVERHITLDRAMWGSDQAASVEPSGLMRLVRDIRVIETAMGDGVKQVYESEMKARQRLRRASISTGA
jgi:N-acetylneuraminate synthase